MNDSRRIHTRLLPGFLGCLFVLCAATGSSAAIGYTVSLEHPEKHLFYVEMQLPQVTGSVVVQMPAWNALYQIRDFSSHMREVTAFSGDKPAPVEKLDKQTWRVTGDGTIKVRYETYWDEAGPFATQLSSEHAFINLAMILLYVPERRAENIGVTVREIPAGWRLATALPTGDAEFGRAHVILIQAKNFDELVDSPVEAGNFDEFDLPGFTPRIHIVIHGDNWKRDRVIETLRRVCRYELDLMQDTPFESYTFFFHIGKAAGGAGGGMEHSFSTAINVPADEFLAGVSAHEFFHLWNVKRIRPASLEPVDYSKEQWTRALWFAEGFTSAYGSYTLVRSGLWNKEQFYTDLGDQITDLESRPANRWKSAEESSLDAWLEKYALYNTPDESVSYYTKGQVLGVLLDILIRDRTNNSASLDDVLRTMNKEFAKQGKTYRDTLDVRLTMEKIAGQSFENFFQHFVAAAEPLPYKETLALAGLELQAKSINRAAPGFALSRAPSGDIRVAGVVLGSGAAVAGLRDGDVILKVNDAAIPRRLDRWLRQQKPGDRIRLQIRRDEQGLSLEFALGEQNDSVWVVTESTSASEKARRIREGLVRGITQPR